HRAVICAQRHDLPSNLIWIAVAGFAVREVQDRRWKAARVLLQPLLEHHFYFPESFAHRRLAIGSWMDPDGITHGYLNPAAGAVRYSFVAALHLQREVGDF